MISICRIKQGCFGCCGTQLCKTKKEVIATVEQNTEELKQFTDLNKFRDRKGPIFPTDPKAKITGLCQNVTKLKDGTYGCPLHEMQNNGKDYRERFCLPEYECPTLKIYKRWTEKTQKKFVEFLEKRYLDPFSYSIRMEKDLFLKEFRKQRKTI